LTWGDRHGLQARIVDVATQHFRERALHLLGDATGARDFTRHGAPLRAARDLDPGEALDLVTRADVVVIAHADAALGAGANFVDVVLEASQRVEFALVDHHVVAQHAHRVARLMTPSTTRQPATVPNLLERNTSRTSARPTICSLTRV